MSPQYSRGKGKVRFPAIGAGILVLLMFFGCFSPPDAKDLEERSRLYMDTRQRRDWATILDEFLDPESHSRIDRKEFLHTRRSGFDILAYEIVSLEVEGDGAAATGRVRMKLDALIPVLEPGGGTRTLRRDVEDPQTWVVRDGRWYIQRRG